MARSSAIRYVLPVVALVALALAVAIVSTTQPDRSRTEPEVRPPTVPAGLTGGVVYGAGIVEPSSELIEIGAQRPGIVSAVAVEVGDRVSPGQLLFAVDDREARARLAEAGSAVDLARHNVAAARTELRSAQRLLGLYQAVEDPRAVSRQEIIDHEAARNRAAAQLAVARAELDQAVARQRVASTQAALHRVTAPRAGQVLQVSTRPGEYVTAGPAPGESEPFITLGETRPLHVRVDVDENEIGRVRSGAAAIVSPRGNSGRRVRAEFVRTEPLVVPKRSLTNRAEERVDVRVLQLIYALPADAGNFFVGQQVDAFLPASGRAGGSGEGTT